MEFERDDDYTPYDEDDDDWEMPEPDPDPDEDEDEAEVIPCPKCGCDIYEDAEQCPLCGEYIVHHTAPWWVGRTTGYILLALLGILATIAALMAI